MIRAPAPLVLCYHGISDAWEHRLAVRRASFESQLKSFLRRGYRPATARETLHSRERLVHVTFDDAYTNIASAVPILERLGVPGTIFACSGYAVDGRPLDVPELAGDAAAQPRHMATMTWNDLRGLAERGFEVGSHTVTHPHLPSLEDGDLDRELRDSRARCEDELGRPCSLLAYPYGDHDERVQAAARRAGYEAAFALRAGSDQGNQFALPRIDLYRIDHLVRATLKTSAARPVGSAVLELLHRVQR